MCCVGQKKNYYLCYVPMYAAKINIKAKQNKKELKKTKQNKYTKQTKKQN